MVKRFLSGDEAVARGAWESGVRVATAYPGTPSTEILEAFAPMPGGGQKRCARHKDRQTEGTH